MARLITFLYALIFFMKITFLYMIYFTEMSEFERLANGIIAPLMLGAAGSSFWLIQLVAIILDASVIWMIWTYEGEVAQSLIRWIFVLTLFVLFAEPFVILSLGDFLGFATSTAVTQIIAIAGWAKGFTVLIIHGIVLGVLYLGAIFAE